MLWNWPEQVIVKQDTRFYVHLPTDRMQIVHPMIRHCSIADRLSSKEEACSHRVIVCRRFREHLEDEPQASRDAAAVGHAWNRTLDRTSSSGSPELAYLGFCSRS